MLSTLCPMCTRMSWAYRYVVNASELLIYAARIIFCVHIYKLVTALRFTCQIQTYVNYHTLIVMSGRALQLYNLGKIDLRDHLYSFLSQECIHECIY